MIEFFQRGWFARHGAFLLAIASWLLMLALFSQWESVRAVVAVVSIALLLYQWLSYRKTTSGAGFVFLSLMVAVFGLANVWLAFNVVRFYTYDPESRTWAWHSSVVRTQTGLAWVIGLLVVFVSVWALLRFVRWLASSAST